MAAKYILAAFAIVFLLMALVRGAAGGAARTWLLIALIFVAVAAWLQWHTS
ncbi:hypothetical protein J2W32_005845 [Variovorax boronicumulans]|uniref:Uncharacterized protein n=1 Tax=Variovorax boronicumulans TaxID=436515 RepID=A0AAW8DBN0_9BURK|nr:MULTISPECIES: hypothetical protein [Variovorax]MDP9896735.1 hypothetical protein [Variovorax boronicumulans]MDQ0034154.1 hypothetical protein [Variovorax boronicumulans]MDQ0056776.1 hypothetical protein [Variovorax boronicumulans]MDQ0612157.1 hypothetical protein [Variovorax sp. W1I1]